MLAASAQTRPSAAFSKLAAQADAARKMDDPQAAALYAHALELNPSWKEGWWSLGTLHYQKDRYVECRDAFQRLTALDSKSGPAVTMLGLCEFSARQYDAALVDLRHGQELGVATEAVN